MLNQKRFLSTLVPSCLLFRRNQRMLPEWNIRNSAVLKARTTKIRQSLLPGHLTVGLLNFDTYTFSSPQISAAQVCFQLRGHNGPQTADVSAQTERNSCCCLGLPSFWVGVFEILINVLKRGAFVNLRMGFQNEGAACWGFFRCSAFRVVSMTAFSLA